MQSWLTHAESWPAVNARGGAINGTPFNEGSTRIAVDTSNATSVRIASLSYGESGRVPHFTLDATAQVVAQHLDIQLGPVGVTDFPVEPHRFGHNIWITVLTPAGQAPTAEESMWLGGEVLKIAEAVGSSADLYDGAPMGVGEWLRFEGVAFASDAPLTHASKPRVDIDLFRLALAGEQVVSGFEVSDEELSPEVVESLEEIENGDVTFAASVEEFAAALEGTATIETETIMNVTTIEEPSAVTINADTVLGKFPGRKVKVGSGGKAVATMKEAFGLGTGKFDDELEDHVKMIQELAGLPVDGVVDSDTWAAIDEHLLEE